MSTLNSTIRKATDDFFKEHTTEIKEWSPETIETRLVAVVINALQDAGFSDQLPYLVPYQIAQILIHNHNVVIHETWDDKQPKEYLVVYKGKNELGFQCFDLSVNIDALIIQYNIFATIQDIETTKTILKAYCKHILKGD